jgi:transcriptional regulator with PAS, ATPase and Fis domain
MTITEAEIQSIKQRFGIIGTSPLLNNAVRVAMQVAPTDMSVLITGESGSGKESFSKIIHHLSPRKHGQFIAINCGSIPEGTIDSELFGHEKGSFTGAHEARKGYFEVTSGGTIFLDEIGEMPLGTQARLLRVLENGEFIKVGSSKVQKTDVRVVAATNVNLMKNVDDGKFREDLYYRLSTVPIFVPPLRERGKDVELLFRKFATDFAEKYKVKPITLTDDAKEILPKYRFPGNIRQLKNLVEQISVLSTEDKEITAEGLQRYLPKENNLPALYRNPALEKEGLSERDILYKVLFDMIETVGGADILVFASDFPHWDLDDPAAVIARLPESWRQRVLHDNALDFYAQRLGARA